MKLDLPAFNIAEVTLLGTGGGYGESIVLHIGDNEWILVDSYPLHQPHIALIKKAFHLCGYGRR